MIENRTVREAMTTAYVGVSESDTVGDVADVMLEEGVADVVVLRGTDPVGTVTERDLLRAATTGTLPVRAEIASLMSGPGPSIDAEMPLAEAASMLLTEDERQLLVTNADELVGVLTARDVIATAASLFSSPDSEPETIPSGPTGNTETPEYTTQSVCENCGSFMPRLEAVNGQVVCGDCRSI